jgi:DNA-binding PadR family transcriptional regulator
MIAPIAGRRLGVPRGLLGFLVLKMLSEKPMSGMEIIEEIETQTGSWKPSPGSIYPLLARLEKKGFTKELPKDEMGSKRYVFTGEGKKFFKQQVDAGKAFIERIEFLAPMLVGGFNLECNNNKFFPSKETVQKLVKSFIFLRQNFDNVTEEDAKELSEVLEDGYVTVEKIVQRIKNKKQSNLTDN